MAVKELEKESLVYRRQGSGTFVSAAPNKAAVTRSTFTEFIKGLKQDVTCELLDSRWVKASPELACCLAVPVRAALLWFRRLDRIDGKIMAFDEGRVFRPYAHLLGADDLCVLDFYEHWQRKQGIKIVKAELELAAAPADKETARILEIKKGAPVLVEVSNVFTEENGAARFSTCYKHDMYRFKTTLHYT